MVNTDTKIKSSHKSRKSDVPDEILKNKHSRKRQHSSDSSSDSSVNREEKKRSKKHRKKKRSSSSSSFTSSSSSDEEEVRRKKERKKAKKKAKKLKKHLKKIQKRKEKQAKNKLSDSSKTDSCNDVPVALMDRTKAMAPMTKEEWEKKQSVVRRVYDEETGRHRLIKGDGEVIEEIVSRDRHKTINKQATIGDGNFFQAKLSLQK